MSILVGGKTYVTCDSRVVPHRSTEQAQWCLTSEFGRDLVLSPWYERMIRLIRIERHVLGSNQKWAKNGAKWPYSKVLLQGLEPWTIGT